MSKASDYATNKKPAQLVIKLLPNHPLQDAFALVERNGGLFLQITHHGMAAVGGSFSLEEALRLGHWLLDTFGDPA